MTLEVLNSRHDGHFSVGVGMSCEDVDIGVPSDLMCSRLLIFVFMLFEYDLSST